MNFIWPLILFIKTGWQYRWFNVDAKAGSLSYYLSEPSGEDQHHLNNTPRGQVQLAGAVVCPSDEDSKTFTISCASGDTLKLRAADARERQEWVDGLRAITESHTQALSSANLPPREHLAASDAMSAARQQIQQTELSNAALARLIESSNISTDPDYLLLKAISAANTHCLIQCLGLLQRYQETHDNRIEP